LGLYGEVEEQGPQVRGGEEDHHQEDHQQVWHRHHLSPSLSAPRQFGFATQIPNFSACVRYKQDVLNPNKKDAEKEKLGRNV
jgi:hypothetical protein